MKGGKIELPLDSAMDLMIILISRVKKILSRGFIADNGNGKFLNDPKEKQEMNERIVIDPEIQHGKPVIRGTRVPITRILGGLAGGMTHKEIMREYGVNEEDILAALGYASDLIESEEFHPLPG